MKGGQKKPDKRLKARTYLILSVLCLFVCEILFNIFNITPSAIVNGVYLAADMGLSVGIHKTFNKWGHKLEKLYRYIIYILKNEKSDLSLSEHALCELLKRGILFIYPLVSNGIRSCAICILILLMPVAATFHPIGHTWNVARSIAYKMEKAIEVDKVQWRREKVDSEEDKEVDTVKPDEPDLDDSMSQAMEETAETDEAVVSEKATENVTVEEENTFEGTFRLTDKISEEDIAKIRRLVLYYDGAYAVKDDDKEKLLKQIKIQIEDITRQEPDYMEEYFPVNINEDSPSGWELNEMEAAFYNEIDRGALYGAAYIPDSSELDQIIDGRKGIVRELQSNKTALALANNYLQYVLEYEAQGRTDDARLYYSGMAILAGQLQLCYAENKEQEDEAVNWIYSRYKEIRDMEMVADTDRVDDIINCYEYIMAARKNVSE